MKKSRNKNNQSIGKIKIPKRLIIEKEKPRYNAYQDGFGKHKSVKDYSRKEKYKKDYLQEEY